MYPEFVGIYVLLAILIVLSAVSIYLQVSRSKNNGGNKSNFNSNQQNNAYQAQSFDKPNPRNSGYPSGNNQRQQTPAYGTSGVVFCKSCATQFDARHKVCPRCGTPR